MLCVVGGEVMGCCEWLGVKCDQFSTKISLHKVYHLCVV